MESESGVPKEKAIHVPSMTTKGGFSRNYIFILIPRRTTHRWCQDQIYSKAGFKGCKQDQSPLEAAQVGSLEEDNDADEEYIEEDGQRSRYRSEVDIGSHLCLT